MKLPGILFRRPGETKEAQESRGHQELREEGERGQAEGVDEAQSVEPDASHSEPETSSQPVPPDKATLVGQCESAKKLLDERRYEYPQLIGLLDEIRRGAKLRSAALQERSHDYWDEMAHVTEPLHGTLKTYQDGGYEGEPTHNLTEQINAFVTAAEDAAAEAG